MGDEEKGKYLVQLSKIFNQCPPTELPDKVREAFKIKESFQLQIFDKEFEEWADVTDFKTLPLKCKLKVVTG